jgi:hypothetical protein
VITIDGLRVEYADGFDCALIQHDAGHRARFSDDEAALKKIQEDFRAYP